MGMFLCLSIRPAVSEKMSSPQLLNGFRRHFEIGIYMPGNVYFLLTHYFQQTGLLSKTEKKQSRK
jgi:hypothetical protein